MLKICLSKQVKKNEKKRKTFLTTNLLSQLFYIHFCSIFSFCFVQNKTTKFSIFLYFTPSWLVSSTSVVSKRFQLFLRSFFAFRTICETLCCFRLRNCYWQIWIQLGVFMLLKMVFEWEHHWLLLRLFPNSNIFVSVNFGWLGSLQFKSIDYNWTLFWICFRWIQKKSFEEDFFEKNTDNNNMEDTWKFYSLISLLFIDISFMVASFTNFSLGLFFQIHVLIFFKQIKTQTNTTISVIQKF